MTWGLWSCKSFIPLFIHLSMTLSVPRIVIKLFRAKLLLAHVSCCTAYACCILAAVVPAVPSLLHSSLLREHCCITQASLQCECVKQHTLPSFLSLLAFTAHVMFRVPPTWTHTPVHGAYVDCTSWIHSSSIESYLHCRVPLSWTHTHTLSMYTHTPHHGSI